MFYLANACADLLLGSVLLVVDVVKALLNCPDKVLLLKDAQLTFAGSMLSSDSIIYEPLASCNAMVMIAVHWVAVRVHALDALRKKVVIAFCCILTVVLFDCY